MLKSLPSQHLFCAARSVFDSQFRQDVTAGMMTFTVPLEVSFDLLASFRVDVPALTATDLA